MRLGPALNAALIPVIAALVVTAACGAPEDQTSQSQRTTLNVSQTENFYGWNTELLRNAYTRMRVIPELGSRIISYEAFGVELLWHNTELEGQIEPFRMTASGGEFVEAGGAKVWPGSPSGAESLTDQMLDASAYETIATDSLVTMVTTLDAESDENGLRYRHTYALHSGSTVLDLGLSLSDAVDRDVPWVLHHIVDVPAMRRGTLYAPVAEGDWDILDGAEAPEQWLGVSDGLFRARYGAVAGAVGLKLTDGWLLWHDEDHDIAFVIRFPADRARSLPDDGRQVTVRASVAAQESSTGMPSPMDYLELSILSPVQTLAPGRAADAEVTWAACVCSEVSRVTPFGVVGEEFAINDGVLTGKYGSFYGGKLQLYFTNSDGKMVSQQEIADLSPFSEKTIQWTLIIPSVAERLEIRILDQKFNLLGTVGELSLR